MKKVLLAMTVVLLAAAGLCGCIKKNKGGNNNVNLPHPDTDYPPAFVELTKVPAQERPVIIYTEVYEPADSIAVRLMCSAGTSNSKVVSIVLSDSQLGECTYTKADETFKITSEDYSYGGLGVFYHLLVPAGNVPGTRTLTAARINFENGYWLDNEEIKYIIPSGEHKTLNLEIGGRINFHTEYGTTVTPNTVFDKVGTEINLNSFVPSSRTGYEFVGWYLENAATPYTATAIPAAVIDLYARLVPKTNIPVTYDKNGGNISGVTGKTVTFDSSYGDLPDKTLMSRFGYEFTGWRNINGAIINSATIVKQESAHTLFAIWTPKKVDVNIDCIQFTNKKATVEADFDSGLYSAINSAINNYTILSTPLGYHQPTFIVKGSSVPINGTDKIIALSPIDVEVTWNCKFGGGYGTHDYPFLITNADQIETMRNEVNGYATYNSSVYFKLANDVTLGGSTWIPFGTPNMPFRAHFDGNGKTISNLKGYISNTINNFGLFGYNDGEIKDLNVAANISIDASIGSRTSPTSIMFGGLCAYNNGLISNCTVTYSAFSIKITPVNDNNVIVEATIGGLCGINGGTITKGEVSGALVYNATLNAIATGRFDSSFGAIVGRNIGTTEKCISLSGITFITNDKQMNSKNFIGGIVGDAGGTVSDCISKSAINVTVGVTTVNTTYSYVGGIAGRVSTSGAVQYTVAQGDIIVTAVMPYNTFVGGIVGTAENDAVTESIAMGDIAVTATFVTNVLPEFVGRIVGSGSAENCFYRQGQIITRTNGVQTSHEPMNVIGNLATAGELSTESFYTDLGFDATIWDFANLPNISLF